MSEKEKPKNILEPQPLAEQRKELLGKYSKDRSKKNAGLLRSMIRNGRSCVSDLLHAGVSRKQTFRAYYLTGCIVCVVLWVNSYPSTDWCVVSASQAVQSKLYHQYGKQVAWGDVPDGVEGVVRYAKRLGLSTGETQASAELYQQEMTACHTFARPIGRLGYAGVALFLLHCLIRLLECFLVHRFRPSEEDRVSLLAAVAGITFYVVASFLCFSPPLHAPIIGLQERVFREYGLVRPPGAAEPIPTFTNVLYNVTQKTVFRQNPLYLSLVQPILSGKSASEPIPSAGSLFPPCDDWKYCRGRSLRTADYGYSNEVPQGSLQPTQGVEAEGERCALSKRNGVPRDASHQWSPNRRRGSYLAGYGQSVWKGEGGDDLCAV
ncbi:hypothetical protein AGDE_13152 [Angomonas deanei]|uniref:Uncharacterized protein n=1 Tax=Angomonas deanei TaxID=59799 RepID=A0A7G2C6K6_9TRYP|nr:hypothetical protein AGDE_13152 [Angomonas deanei]CAD2215458.1 hypothetical protein, conserved [Angomonas deanei]|eukprot:EPY22633.1 hypothetical protein AGDE_13152 [Angomonas deanei]